MFEMHICTVFKLLYIFKTVLMDTNTNQENNNQKHRIEANTKLINSNI